MPSAPPRVCARCGRPANKNQSCSCRPPWEGSKHASSNDRRWQQVRDAQLRDHPYCQWIQSGAVCGRVASVVDHIKPLAEGGERYDFSNLQSLCDPHHTEKTIADARRGKTRAR